MPAAADIIAMLSPIKAGMKPLDVITAKRMNAIQDGIRLMLGGEFLAEGSDIGVEKGVAGQVKLSLKPRHSSPASSSIVFPWLVTLSGDDATGSTNVSLFPGKINEVLPSNIFSSVAYTDPTATQYVVLNFQTDANNIIAADWELRTEYPSPDENGVEEDAAPAEGTVVLAIIFRGIVYQLEDDHLEYLPEVAFIASKNSPSPYEEQFTRWWRWVRQ